MTEIKPVELKVTLYTNIPSGTDYENITLTFSTLSSEDLKDVKIKPTTYPFFSYQIKYPETILAALSYADVVKTFFDKDEFKYKFGNIGDILTIDENEIAALNEDNKKNEKIEYYNKRTDNINNNVMLMLRYLLPTKWPVVNNHFNSYDLFKGKDPMNTLFFNPFSTSKYVYLKLTGGTFTMKKLIWLNDFLNHPDYKNVFEESVTEIKLKNGKSSNSLLQEQLDKDQNQQDLLENIKRCYLSSCKNEMPLTYVGMQIDTDPYEIVVDVELFENEVKSGEESKIKCAYYGDYLGEELTRLLKQNRMKIKHPKGLIVKMPLFSTTNMSSRKQGDIDKEEIDKDKKEKRKKEDTEYNDIERDLRMNYENVVNKFFDNMNKGALKTRIKKIDINKKNFYNFLEENLPKLFRYIISTDSEKYDNGANIFDETLKKNITKGIDVNLTSLTSEKNRKRITKEDYDRLKINFDLAKELVNYIFNKQYNPQYKRLFPGGSLTKKSFNKIKRRHTRKR